MNNIIKEFKNYLIINGYADKTIVSYTQKTKDYLKFIKISYKQENISYFFLHLKSKNYLGGTIDNYLKALKLFFKYKEINVNFPKYNKPIRKLVDAISEKYFYNDVFDVVSAIFPNPYKVKAILATYFYTGLRRDEMVILKRKNFNFEHRYIRVIRSKTKQEDLVIIPKELKGILLTYFESEEEYGNAFNTTSASINSIFRKLKPYFKCDDINMRPNLLRHSCGTHYLKNGCSIREVQEILGHSSLKTTERYLSVNINDLKTKIDRISDNKNRL